MLGFGWNGVKRVFNTLRKIGVAFLYAQAQLGFGRATATSHVASTGTYSTDETMGAHTFATNSTASVSKTLTKSISLTHTPSPVVLTVNSSLNLTSSEKPKPKHSSRDAAIRSQLRKYGERMAARTTVSEKAEAFYKRNVGSYSAREDILKIIRRILSIAENNRDFFCTLRVAMKEPNFKIKLVTVEELKYNAAAFDWSQQETLMYAVEHIDWKNWYEINVHEFHHMKQYYSNKHQQRFYPVGEGKLLTPAPFETGENNNQFRSIMQGITDKIARLKTIVRNNMSLTDAETEELQQFYDATTGCKPYPFSPKIEDVDMAELKRRRYVDKDLKVVVPSSKLGLEFKDLKVDVKSFTKSRGMYLANTTSTMGKTALLWDVGALLDSSHSRYTNEVEDLLEMDAVLHEGTARCPALLRFFSPGPDGLEAYHERRMTEEFRQCVR